MRHWIVAAFAAVLAMPLWATEMGDDGLHKADWMRDTFKDLKEDFAEAKAEGKRLLILVEQRGCLYCKDMHENTFTDPRVKAMLEETYFPVQINLHGDTEIVDTDGEALSEKDATRKWRVLFTPTMIFFPPELEDGKPANEQAVAIMPGAFSAGTTFDLFNWVAEERYLDQSEEDFQRYHARMIRERNDGDTR
ncbi:thioredoxin family protein [Sedimentitalea sp. JM2-8]|uniref:Thioredoxin family protein n=1 Tax=Sedimentitalea xiamensis TaxID=3050037 RepID=A0ABT7FGX9_9RHOB|nr:thioredoxin family protein [Sedimentitalea xiamensis]MDK3074401.1 thioredoxin family protein [Sedimentitalea xiamensis]